MAEEVEFITFDGDIITKSDYREELIEEYIQANYDGLTKITDFTVGSEAYHLVDILAGLKLEFREQIDTNYQMIMIHTTVGEFLDNYGDRVGVHRRGSSPSEGIVTFSRLSSSTNSQIVIPDETVVSTDDAISFIVDNEDEDLIIAEGETSVTANVICEQEGAFTNVEAGTITLVIGNPGTLVSVTNLSQMEGGEDIEEDDDYRNRILEAPYNVPTGSLAWYSNVSEELESVHDVTVRKGTVLSEGDIVITFNPENWEDTVVRTDINDYNEDNDIESTSTSTMTVARADLVDNFMRPEYDIAGIAMTYHLAEKHPVLVSDSTDTYLFAVLVDLDYQLSELKPLIVEKITNFNKGAQISIEFSPHTLASIIENEIEGVDNCRIVKKTEDSYVEVAETIGVDSDQIYEVDLTDIETRIVPLQFNLDLNGDG